MKPASCLRQFVVFFLLCGSLLAQQYDPNSDAGFTPYGAYHGGDIDSVSLSSGNLILHIPLASYPQRGELGWSYLLNLNSKNWTIVIHPVSNGYYLKWEGNPKTGSGVTPTEGHALTVTRLRIVNPVTTSIDDYAVRTWDRGSHPLSKIGPNTYETNDATGIRVEVYPGPNPDGSTDTGTIIDKQGIRYHLSSLGIGPDNGGKCVYNRDDNNDYWYTCDDESTTASIEDTNGNEIVNATSGTIADTLNRSVNTFPGPNGGTSPFVLSSSNHNLSTAFQCCSAMEGAATQSMLDSVTLPNGTKWLFSYDQYGSLTSITFPTGGTITYTWVNIASIYQGQPNNMSRYVHTRTVDAHDGSGPKTWTYDWNVSSITCPGGTHGVTITDPLGNQSTHQLSNLTGCSGYYETQSQEYELVGGTQVLRKTVQTQYSFAQSGINVVPTVITTILPNGQTTQVTKTYDYAATGFAGNTPFPITLGNVLEEKEFDYGINAPGLLERKTLTSYLAFSDANYLSRNLLDLVSSAVTCSPWPAAKAPTAPIAMTAR